MRASTRQRLFRRKPAGLEFHLGGVVFEFVAEFVVYDCVRGVNQMAGGVQVATDGAA